MTPVLRPKRSTLRRPPQVPALNLAKLQQCRDSTAAQTERIFAPRNSSHLEAARDEASGFEEAAGLEIDTIISGREVDVCVFDPIHPSQHRPFPLSPSGLREVPQEMSFGTVPRAMPRNSLRSPRRGVREVPLRRCLTASEGEVAAAAGAV